MLSSAAIPVLSVETIFKLWITEKNDYKQRSLSTYGTPQCYILSTACQVPILAPYKFSHHPLVSGWYKFVTAIGHHLHKLLNISTICSIQYILHQYLWEMQCGYKNLNSIGGSYLDCQIGSQFIRNFPSVPFFIIQWYTYKSMGIWLINDQRRQFTQDSVFQSLDRMACPSLYSVHIFPSTFGTSLWLPLDTTFTCCRNENLPQGWVLHSLDCFSSPSPCSLQVFPPCSGFGLVQVRDCHWTPPPQVAEHSDHLLHSEYPPSISIGNAI